MQSKYSIEHINNSTTKEEREKYHMFIIKNYPSFDYLDFL